MLWLLNPGAVFLDHAKFIISFSRRKINKKCTKLFVTIQQRAFLLLAYSVTSWRANIFCNITSYAFSKWTASGSNFNWSTVTQVCYLKFVFKSICRYVYYIQANKEFDSFMVICPPNSHEFYWSLSFSIHILNSAGGMSSDLSSLSREEFLVICLVFNKELVG